MDELIIISNDKGTPTGEYIPKEEGHVGEGKKHLAIVVLLYNLRGELLLQKRKHKRFDDLWDLTGATDLYRKEDNESFEQATLRCLKREYGIDKVDIKKVGAFNYFAEYKDLCENEYCAVMIGEYDGPIQLNPEVGYGYLWMRKDGLLKEITDNPHNFSPWSIEAVEVLKQNGFFES